MLISDIRSIIEHHTPCPEGYRNYAVLIPLIKNGGDTQVLYEIRSDSLRSQPGEISFPGGKVEPDESPAAAAIRETHEELNIPLDSIDLLGEVNTIITPFNMIIHCFVGVIDITDHSCLSPNSDEVKELFSVPLKYLLENDSESYVVTSSLNFPDDFPFERIQRGKSYNWKNGEYPIMFYPYKEHMIWGITAKITHQFIQILKKPEPHNCDD